MAGNAMRVVKQFTARHIGGHGGLQACMPEQAGQQSGTRHAPRSDVCASHHGKALARAGPVFAG
jgi:hypothetical protein